VNPADLPGSAIDLFTEVGGPDWYDKAVMGGMAVIAFLLVAVLLLLIYELRKP